MPEKEALVFGDHRIEYGRLLEAIRRLAQGLKDLGVESGDRVAVMLPNLPHFCISYYAALQIGAVVVPINIISQEDELAYYLKDSGAKVLISWSGFTGHIIPAVQQATACKEVLLLGDKIPASTKSLTQIIAQSTPLKEIANIGEDKLAVINYTVLSSETALGAELTNAALMTNANACQEMFRIAAEDKVLAVIPLFHSLGQSLVMNAAFCAGASLILLPRFVPSEVVEKVHDHGTTIMAAVPAMFRALADMEMPDDSPSVLKYCISYGGQLNEETVRNFEDKFNAFIMEAYGFTQAGGLVTSNRINRDRKFGSVGLPLLGIEIQIRNEVGEQLRPNQSGEIWIKSPSLMSAYYNNPEETEKILIDGWLFSGDIGLLDDDHYLYIQERKEDIIEKAGFHIFPREVESIIAEHPAVAEVAVVGVPANVQGYEVKAFIVLKESQSASEQQFAEHCKERLPVYKIPKFIEFCQALPKSATGRILKYKLRQSHNVAEINDNN